MAEKNSAHNEHVHDEKLIQELYEKLWWYTHEASEEEFNEKEVEAILQLLEVLEPIKEDHVFEPGADAALERFKERFGLEGEFAESGAGIGDVVSAAGGDVAGVAAAVGSGGTVGGSAVVETVAAVGGGNITDAALVGSVDREETVRSRNSARRKNARRRKPDWKKIAIRVGIGVAACFVLLISLNVGTYALRRQSFFEMVRLGNSKTEVFVTGNSDENQNEPVKYASWDELESAIGKSDVEPEFIPDKFVLNELVIQELEYYRIITAKYFEET